MMAKPLIEMKPEIKKVLSIYDAQFKNYNENEEATRILRLECLRVSPFKYYFLTPLLCLCTGGIFLLFLYWYKELRIKFLYTRCRVREATRILVTGFSK
jgi:hypothetical protein